MHCIIFDIDGTLIHSHKKEVDCFLIALKEVAGIEEVNLDLNHYEHVTDWGIINQCFIEALQREPTLQEMHAIENKYLHYFEQSTREEPIIPILGVESLLTHLLNSKELAVGIATGSYLKSAHLKLRAVYPQLCDLPMGTSSDHYARIKIMEHSLAKAQEHYNIAEFKSITYIGDGPWDITASRALNWNFIGIASSYSATQLQAWGATNILPHYNESLEQILLSINQL